MAAPALLHQALSFVASTRGHPKARRTLRGAAEDIQAAPAKMTDLRVGQELMGIITRVTERIALVDIGVEKVGLLPGSKIWDGPMPKDVSVQDKLQEGHPIKVYVAEVENPEDPRNGKIVLAGHPNKIVNPYQFGEAADLKDVKAELDRQQEAQEKVFCTGMVTAKKDFGVIVAFRSPNVTGIIQGLVYKTEMKGQPDVMDKVEVRLAGVENRRIKLSMIEDDPLTGAAARFINFRGLEKKTILKAKVQGFADFGAFVEVTPPEGNPATALLPTREIKDGYVEDPAEELEEGQEINVVLLEITEKGLRVSKKQAEAKSQEPAEKTEKEAA